MRASVVISEVDLSTRVPSFPGIYAGIVIPAKKGTVNDRTLITTETQLLSYFTPDDTIKVGYDTSYYSALSFLLKSNKLWTVRAANDPLYGGAFLAQAPPLATIGITATNGNDCIVINHATAQEILDSAAFFACVVTAEKVTVTSTGTVPAGLVSGTTYYLIIFDEDTHKVRLANTAAEAIAGTYIDFSSDGTGTLSLNLVGTLAANSIEYGLSDPTTYVLDSSDGKYAGLTSAFVVTITNNAFNVSSDFYNMIATADTLNLTAVVFPTVGSGDPLDAITTYYAIKVVGSQEVQIARSAVEALNGTAIPITSQGTTVVGTLLAKNHTGTFTVNTGTEELTPQAAVYTACEDGDVVRCTSSGTLPLGIGIAEVTDLTCIAGSTTLRGKYFTLSSPSVDYYTWYQVAVKEETTISSIVFPVGSDYFTLNSVAPVIYDVWYAIDAIAQVTTITSITLPSAAEYFTITSTAVSYYVWYTVDGGGADPTPAGTGIVVAVLSGDSDIDVAVKTAAAMHAFGGAGVIFNVPVPAVSAIQITNVVAGTVIAPPADFNTGFVVTDTLTGADEVGAAPGLGHTEVKVNITTGDSGVQVAIKTAAAIHAIGGAGVVFNVPVPIIAAIVVTNVVPGVAIDAADGAGGAATGYSIITARQGEAAAGANPSPAGLSPIAVVINSTDTAIEVAVATAAAIHAIGGAGVVFNVPAPATEVATITNVILGECIDAVDVDTGFTLLVTADGRGSTTDYYIISKGVPVGKIKLSQTLGGTTIDITSAGAGTLTITLQDKINTSSFVGDLSDNVLTVSTTFYNWISSKNSVTVSVSAGGTLPTPLASSTTYYVIKGGINSIKLAASLNDIDLNNPIDLLDGGTGTFTIYNTQNQELFGLERKCLLVYGCNQGDWNNKIYIQCRHYPYGDSSTWNAYQQSMADLIKEPGCFLLYVWKEDDEGNVALVENPILCSRIPGKKDGYGTNVYVEDAVQVSNYIRVIDNDGIDSSIYPADQTQILAFAYGDNGGTVTDTHMLQALDALANKRDVFVTLLLDGGWTTPAWQLQGLINLAETRKDCFAICSVPYSDEVSSTYMTDILAYRKTELNANSSYGALFTSHLYIQDKYNDRKIYIAPDGYVGAAISETASNYEIWYAPAGPRRGILNVLDVARRFTEGDMDTLYDNGINPIDYYPGKGIRIWGQKTLLSRPSALDRINVRLLLITIEPAIAEFLEDFLFEFNDAPTRALISSGISSYMENIKSRRGVYAFTVTCDASNNTPEVIDANELAVFLYVQPTRTAEFIRFKTIITRTGATVSL